MTAPIALALILSIAAGMILQRSRICTAGGFRDLILIRDNYFFWGLVGIFLFNLIGNLVFNFETFNIGFSDQPVAHSEHLWNFLGMTLTGICSIFLGGCPLRQTILASEGDSDAGITVLGLITGAALTHNFDIASSPKGVTTNGKMAVIVGLIVVLTIGCSVVKNINSQKEKGVKEHA